MRRTFMGLLALVMLGSAYGQQDTTNRNRHPYLGLTVGLASMKVKDDLVMPVRYGGTNFAFGLNYLKKKPKSIQEVNIEGVIGGLSTKEADRNNFGARYKEPRSNLYWGDINYVWMHSIPKLSSEKYRTFMGASAFVLANVRFNERWDNSAINYDAAISPLAFQGRVERDFKTWKKQMTVSFNLGFPLIVYVMRPEFSGVPDFVDHETDFIRSLTSTQNSQWTGFWDFPRIKTQLDLSLPIRGLNFMKFTYKWEYYSFQEPMKTQYGGHSFLFTLFTHL